MVGINMKNLTLLIISVFLLSLFTVIAAPQPGLCYFGDSNGDCIINFIDLKTAQNAAIPKPADYSGVTPSSPDVQDVNGDGFISGNDVLLIRDLMISKVTNLNGKPTQIMIVQAPSQLDTTDGSDVIKVSVTDVDGTPRAGVGVLFTVDDSSIATLDGRDPSDGDNYITDSDSVFELTDTIAQNGEAQITINPLTPGTLTVNMVIPADPNKGVLNDITNSITIEIVDDGTGNQVNNAPVFNTINPVSTYSNQQVQFVVSATDADSDPDPLTYSLVSGPGSFDPATQTYTWTPTQADKTLFFTTYTLLFDVTDNLATTQASTTVTIVNRIPVIQNIADVIIDENNLVSVNPVVTDDDGDVWTVTYSNPLNSNGQWQTDYTSAGAFIITVTTSDGISGTSKTFNLNVNDVAQNNDNQGGNSGGGGSGGSNHNYVNTQIAVPATPAEPTIQPAEPAVPAETAQETNAEQNINAENQNQVTGFSVVDTIKQNPITTAVASVIVLSLLGYGIYWFRK